MKNGKSPGPGNIAAELFKYGGKHLTQRIRDLTNTCLMQQKGPENVRSLINCFLI